MTEEQGGIEIMMIGNLITSALLLIGSVYIIYEAKGMPNLGGGALAGPGFMPICCAVFFVFCAAVMIVKEVLKIMTEKVETESGTKSYAQAELQKVSDFLGLVKHRGADVFRMVVVPVLMIAYGVALRSVGFEISTFIFLVLSMLVCGERKPMRLVAVPIAAIILVYVLFVQFLRVSIPMRFL